MNLRVLSGIVLVGVLSLVWPRQATGETREEAETRQLLRLLQETIDLKDFQNPMTFKELLGLLVVKYQAKGKELPILLNYEAFKKVTPGADDLYERAIRLPTAPIRMPLATVLRVALGQLEDADATYLVRNAAIELLPAKHATPAFLLQARVLGSFVKTPLEDVLQDLAYQTGATVILDPRAGEKARAPITATFRNDATLESALRLIAEMAELKLVVLPGGLFVTTAAQADQMIKERTATVAAGK